MAKKWMQKAAKSIKKRGTAGVCTGSKFGGPTCRPGTRRYALAKTFRKIAKKRKKEEGGLLYDPILDEFYLGGDLPQFGGDVGGSGWTLGNEVNYTGQGLNTGALAGGLGMAGELGSGMIDLFTNPDEIENNVVDINEGALAGKGALKGMAAGASIGSIIPGIGTLIGGGIGALAGGLSGFFGGRAKERRLQGELDEDLKKQRFASDVRGRLGRLQSSPSYMPVAKQGGFTIYKGETHDGPTGGILTDEEGNPAGLSNKPAIALTERNEVARYDPNTKSTYIYSDSLGFAKPARDLVNKYKLDKDNSLYKYDPLLKMAVDKQFDNLMQAQEFAKGTKTPGKEALGMFGKGGSLTSAKAKLMLEEGIANGKPLTAKQKRYFGWVAGGRKEDGGPLGKRKKTTTVIRNNTYNPLTDFNVDAELRNRGLISDTIKTITPQMRVNTILENPDLGYSVSQGNPTANVGGYNYWQEDTTSQINPRTPFARNDAFNRTTPITEPIMKSGGYINKKRKRAVFPFLPIPDAPIGAYVGEDGGFIPIFGGGGLSRKEDYGSKKKPYPSVKSKDFAGAHRSYPIPTLADARDALRLAGLHGRSDIRAKVLARYPGLKKEFGGELLPTYQGDEPHSGYLTPAQKKIQNWAYNFYNKTAPFLGFPSYDTQNRNRYPYGIDIALPYSHHPSVFQYQPLKEVEKAGWNQSDYDLMNSKPMADTQISDMISPGKVLKEPKGTGINRVSPFATANAIPLSRLRDIRTYKKSYKDIYEPLAGAPKMNVPAAEENYSPTLSPLGHILSGVGALADYRALNKAKPTPVSLSRMGAERISLARQRLINERNAAGQRNINTTLGRNLGANAGVAQANISTANTGVNRLLGQENLKSLETEETTNAQMRQQTAAINAELAAQEGLFNTQQLNAWRMARARANPLANLSKVAASYFADNAAYGREFDIRRMLSPNAEIYQSPDSTFAKRFLGFDRPLVRHRDRGLYSIEELRKLLTEGG